MENEKHIYQITPGWHSKYPEGGMVEASIDELAHLLGRTRVSIWRYLRGYPANRLFQLGSEEYKHDNKLIARSLKMPTTISVLENLIEQNAQKNEELLKLIDLINTGLNLQMFKFDKSALINLLIKQKNTIIAEIDDAIYSLNSRSLQEILELSNSEIAEKIGVPYGQVGNWRYQAKQGILSIKVQNKIVAAFNS
jgi:hypothetical protein